MNFKEFERLAKVTGANKCVHFEWSYTIKESCAKDYIEKGILQPCKFLQHKECNCIKVGVQDV